MNVAFSRLLPARCHIHPPPRRDGTTTHQLRRDKPDKPDTKGSGSHLVMVTMDAVELPCLASMIVGQNWRYSPPMTHDHGRAIEGGPFWPVCPLAAALPPRYLGQSPG